MDGPAEHYAKWKASQRKTNIMQLHSYAESNEQNKLTNKMEADS